MKVTIERAQLLKSLGHVHRVVERRNTIPILSNVLLRAQGGALEMKATDLDLEVTETAGADIGMSGATTVPAHTMHDIVRKLPDGAQVSLEGGPDATQLVLRSGRSRFTLQTLPPTDFPDLAAGQFTHRFDIKASDLKKLIDKTQFAISTEETRYYLNGIYLHAAKARTGGSDIPVLRAVATDGHRLARVEMPLPAGAEGIPGVIVPRKTVGEIRNLIDEAASGIEVAMSETKIRFTLDGITLTSKLIDGTYPDYERVIPTGNDKILEVDAKAFAAAVDRVATISTEKSRAVKLSLDRGSVVLSATSPEAGSAQEEIEVSYDAGPLEIGFNSRYLLDITQQIEGDGARFAMADPASPTVVRDVADPSALYLLMPMRV